MEIPDIYIPETSTKRPPTTAAGYVIAAIIVFTVIWQVFLVDKIGLPPAYNTLISSVLIGAAGLLAIFWITLMLLQRVTLESTQVRIRTGFWGWEEAYGYDQIASITPEGDKVTIIFKDGGRQTLRNLRFGDGLSLGQINSLLTTGRPELSILDANVPPKKKKYLM